MRGLRPRSPRLYTPLCGLNIVSKVVKTRFIHVFQGLAENILFLLANNDTQELTPLHVLPTLTIGLG